MKQNSANTRGTVAVAVTGAFRVIPLPGPVLRAAQRLTFSVSHPSEVRVKVSVAQTCLSLCGPWTVALQAPLSVGLSRREYWSGLPFPPPGGLPDQGLNPASCTVGRFFIV